MALPLATVELMTRLLAPLGLLRVEACAILYLDAGRRLVGTRHALGGVDRIDLSVRTVAADALTFAARAAVLAHNHPSGDPTPSPEDVRFTRALARGLDALDVRLNDHVVLAGDRATSMRAIGLI